MDHAGIERLLQQSLQDGKLSRAEKATLRAVLDNDADDRHERDWLRNRIFLTARTALIGPDARKVVDWLEDTVGVLLTAEREPAPAGQPTCEALFSPGNECRHKIQRLIRESRQSADICVFTITDDRITSAILDAHQAGLTIRVISDNDKAADPGNDLLRLKRAGVPVAFDRTPNHMHHKFAIFDDSTVVTGSYNWTRSAADDNHENLVVMSGHAVVQQFRRVFEELWREFGGNR